MSESKIPREPLNHALQEAFVVHEAATGRSFPIRECTDEQLAKNLMDANEQHKQLMMQAMQMIGQALNAGKASAIIAYEIDRRQRTINVASDLSFIHGLRRQ
jgi:hypothetical protein